MAIHLARDIDHHKLGARLSLHFARAVVNAHAADGSHCCALFAPVQITLLGNRGRLHCASNFDEAMQWLQV